MALDTKHRPRRYADVLGQETSVEVLKSYVRSGAGFHQSYLFAGPWGSGKTTLARILARALLCPSSISLGGEPCDECSSCKAFLDDGAPEGYVEVDAATNSGKDSIRKIVDEIQYSTFSGNRRVYLLDESHRLSKDALDALLKPLEDCIPGSQDKRLVVIFCTTEPAKMRETVLSRCAPAFIVRPADPELIGGRLAQVCDIEGIAFERGALNLIGELSECHIRDCLKALEGVSMLPGGATLENVAKYLRVDFANQVLHIIADLRRDPRAALERTRAVMEGVAPATFLEKFADLCMLAYRVGLGVTGAVPTYINPDLLRAAFASAGEELVDYADRLSRRTGKPTEALVLCEMVQLSRGAYGGVVVKQVRAPLKPVASEDGSGRLGASEAPRLVGGVYVDPKGVHRPPSGEAPAPKLAPGLSETEFLRVVTLRVKEQVSAPLLRDPSES